MSVTLLPDSRLARADKTVDRAGVQWRPIFCANCGKDGGLVPADSGFAFYLCDSPCGEQWGQIAGTMAVPDEVFWANVAAEMHEAYGRQLTETEMLVELDNESSVLSKIARDKEK